MPEKQNSQDYFLRSVGATNPKIVKLVLINTCHVQSTTVFQHLRAITALVDLVPENSGNWSK